MTPTNLRCCGDVLPSGIITVTYRGILHPKPYKAFRGGTCQRCGSIIRQETPILPHYLPMFKFGSWQNLRRYLRGDRDTTYYDENLNHLLALNPLVTNMVGPCANCHRYFKDDESFNIH